VSPEIREQTAGGTEERLFQQTAGGNEKRAFGAAIERREDPALINGEAEYTDDIDRPRMVHAAFVRSQYGHAAVEGVDASAAEAIDGVVAVYTAADVGTDVPAEVPVMSPLVDEGVPGQPMLAGDRVRYQGQPIAVVVAETKAVAHDAASAVDVSYDRLDAVADPGGAVEDSAPAIHDATPDNVGYEWTTGDPDATDEAFASAEHVTSIDIENQRIVSNPIEPRGLVADYEGGDRKLTAWVSTQSPHDHQSHLSAALDVPEHRVRVVTPDVGGGFGTKGKVYPDELATAWCAMQLRRPVKWVATRTESFLSDAHARDHVTHAELALDEDGTILGLDVDTKAALGAYVQLTAPIIQTVNYGKLLSGQYEIPAISCRVRGTFTNTAPIDAYRGAGRPEAIYVVERLVAKAARELDIDPVELRRRNFIPPEAFPYETPVGHTYDSGEYEQALDAALEHVGYEAVRERQAELREEGRYVGIGVSCFVENAGSPPNAGLFGSGVVRFRRDGSVQAYTSLTSHGQGHETTFAQVLATELGVDYDDIEVVQGDTDQVPSGVGTAASRSAVMGGNALAESAGKVVEKARRIAAHQFEADPDDVTFEDGEFRLAGAPERSVSIQEVARQSYAGGDLPEGEEPGLEATSFYEAGGLTFPFGAHVAVVEVEPDTGELAIQRYVAIDDCGEQINPLVVEGQIMGGIVQGLGQALLEEAVYDGNGSLLTGSFQDYAMPRAEHVPELELEDTVTPSPTNPLGVKGVGEAGTTGCAPAVVNAVVDALEPFGVEDIGMPLSAERVWQAAHGADE
jgi:carbon-monoxide dehydrogenase large subunit